MSIPSHPMKLTTFEAVDLFTGKEGLSFLLNCPVCDTEMITDLGRQCVSSKGNKFMKAFFRCAAKCISSSGYNVQVSVSQKTPTDYEQIKESVLLNSWELAREDWCKAEIARARQRVKLQKDFNESRQWLKDMEEGKEINMESFNTISKEYGIEDEDDEDDSEEEELPVLNKRKRKTKKNSNKKK